MKTDEQNERFQDVHVNSLSS